LFSEDQGYGEKESARKRRKEEKESGKEEEEERRKKELTALSLSALLINRFASSTSSNSTSSLHLIRACASLNRIILSNCLVVAVILFSWVRESIPALRISTYADIKAFEACSVKTGWILARA
jgi:hypothetical protein